MNPGPILALVGATACGKTDISEAVAEAIGAEIVCADSRQVFRDLSVGTGKPSPGQISARPHHLFDACGLEDTPSAGWFARAAAEVITEIRSRGAVPLLVGGAGLYVRALQEGLAPEPDLDATARVRLRSEHQATEVTELHARLRALDPESAMRLRPRDRQRISRALEVVELSGKPLGWWHAQPARAPVAGEWRVVELRVPPGAASPRIERRTTWMFDHGLMEEIRAVVATGRLEALRRLRAVGYDEAIDLLEGRMDRSAAERRVSQRTRQLAKRQRTWFRHQVAAEVVEAEGAFERVSAEVGARFAAV